MTKNSDLLQLPESLNEDQEYGEGLGILHLCIEMFHGNKASFVVLLIEAADFSINNPTKSTDFHAISFYTFCGKFLETSYDVHADFNELLKPRLHVVMNETLDKTLVETRLISQLFLNNMQFFM